jgi:transcriptional pleiotropic regulator of transition state genes
MKATGIVRKIDELGRIVLPIEMRRNFGMAGGDPVEIFTEKNTVILRKYNPACSYADQIRPSEITSPATIAWTRLQRPLRLPPWMKC